MNKEKWEIKKLGEICETITKGTTPTTLGYQFVEEGVNFVKIEAIDINGNIINENLAYINEECHNALRRSQLEKDDLLFSIAGAIGRTAIVNENIIPANINQALAIIRLKNKNSLFLRFLIYLFKSQLVVAQINNYKVGVAQLNVSLTQLHNLQIPIPPLSTQEKIVSELDTLHRLKELQEEQLAELDNLAQSTFYHLFGDPIENEKGWEVKKLGEVVESKKAIKRATKEFHKNDKISYIDISSINNSTNKITAFTEYIFMDAPSRAQQVVKVGDIIISLVRPNLNNVAILNQIYHNSTASSGFCVLRPKFVDLQFLFFIVKGEKFRNYLNERTTGANYPAVREEDVKSFNLILPPLSLQIQFSERIEKIEAQKALIKQSIGETEQLIGYTMDKYFG